MSQKICLISFDHWNYDHHIVKALQDKNIEAFHIKIGGFKHKNVISRIQNTFSKIFLNKNPKLIKRQEFILDSLKSKGIQDQILVINPETIDYNYHLEIKKYTKKYIAYLYDSVERNPVEHLLDGLFDEIYSFDKTDIEKYGFKETSNYIYFNPTITVEKTIYDYIYIGSIDDRLNQLNNLGAQLAANNKKFIFKAIGKKAFVNKLKQLFLGKNKHITFSSSILNQRETLALYKKSNVIIDFVRDNQKGLSFRIFEAMGLHKNIITNNKAITSYDIFESQKVHLLDDDNSLEFGNYTDNYSEELIYKYSLNNWTNKIFNL